MPAFDNNNQNEGGKVKEKFCCQNFETVSLISQVTFKYLYIFCKKAIKM
jgi:hypothetical protein